MADTGDFFSFDHEKSSVNIKGQTAPSVDLAKSLSRYVNFLSDPSRTQRKRGLEGINTMLFKSDGSTQVPQSLLESSKLYFPAVVKAIADPVEKCRELATSIAYKYFDATKDLEGVLSTLIPCMVQRLGQKEITEPSEELRLQLVELLTLLIGNGDKRLAVYLDDIIKILQNTLVDPFPDVKKESCKTASILAKAIPESFHLQSESLIKPLLQSISHQHSRVRVAVINAIGQVLLYGNNKNVDDVVSHLAQRLFDQAPAVREAVTKLAGLWMLELPDRYSFWHKLMPLLLTSLTDELPSIREEAASLWHDIGIQYLRENENDMKEKEDFAAPPPSHYPENVERPNLGCRELMYRNQSKILPGLSKDILDWVLETRRKSAMLLYTLILNSEFNITQHTQLILESVYKAAVDEDNCVVEYVEKSAVLLGYFVRPDVWVSIVLPTLDKYQHFGSLLALSGLIKGSQKNRLLPYLQQICQSVSQLDFCMSNQVAIQGKLIDCVDSILLLYSTGELGEIPFSFDLFKTLICVISVTTEKSLLLKADHSMNELAILQNSDVMELEKKHTVELLDTFGDSYVHWSSHSPERLVFHTTILRCAPVISEILDRIIPVVVANIHPDKDIEMRLKLFSLVSTLLQRSVDCPASADRFRDFTAVLIGDVILPNCVWKAGRSSTAIRTTAVSCLWCLFKHRIISLDQMEEVVEDLLTQLLTLLEDDSLDTRLISTRVIMHLFNTSSNTLDKHRLYNMYPHLLKRLDDSNDDVRIAVTHTLLAYLDSFGGGYDAKNYRAHIEELIQGLLIHLDDPKPEVQQAVSNVLEKVASIAPDTVTKQVEMVKHKHRTPSYCDQILTYCSKQTSTGND